MINVATGQSQLLIQKKFKQFRELINSCENGTSDMLVTCEDLHGYWDTAYIQVENLNKRFDNLTNMRENNWEEIIPKQKETVIKKAAISKPKAQASSRLKEAIKAAKKDWLLDPPVDEREVDGFTNVRGGPRQSSLNAAIDGKHKVSKKKPGIFKRIGSMFRKMEPEVQQHYQQPAEFDSDAQYKHQEGADPQHTTKQNENHSQNPPNERVREYDHRELLYQRHGFVHHHAEQVQVSLITPGKSILRAKPAESSSKRPKSVLFREDNCNDSEVPVGKLISLIPNVQSLTVTPEQEQPPRVTRRRLNRNKLF